MNRSTKPLTLSPLMPKLCWAGQKATVSLTVLLMILLVFISPTRAQNPGVGGTRANFEIDASFKSGIIPSFWTASNYTPSVTTFGDDWSKGPTGSPVLKQSGGVSVPGQTDDLRSIWKVDGNSGSASTTPEGSTFDGNSNKNSDLIGPGQSPYRVQLGGSTPQKNDLTNTMLHGRVVNGNLWIFFAAETRSDNGSSYLDFEYNQAGVGVQTINGATRLVGNGLVGGRTVGDLLLIVDFEGGGNKPTVAVRRWLPTAEWSDVIPVGTLDAFITTNSTSMDAVAPGRAFNNDGSASDITDALKLVEGGLNITSLQLGGSFNPCNPASTVTVKTRSSPSFTSELKDYDILKFSAIPPGGLTDLTPVTICAGGNASFSTTVSGDGALAANVNWYRVVNGVETEILTGISTSGLTSTLSLTNVATSAAGTYRAKLTGATCGGTVQKDVTLSVVEVTLSATATDVSCFGLSDGSIQVNSNGTVVIKNSQGQTVGATGLPAGTYTITATLPSGAGQQPCSKEIQITIEQPAEVTVKATATNVSCFGEADGTISVTASEGATITINGKPYVAGTKYGPGTYEIVATADGGNAGQSCTAKTTVTIEQPPVLDPPVTSEPQIVCEESPIQTLTATANLAPNAPAGTKIRWFDMASGGKLVPNPILNTVGKVTYYAEAYNGVCVSETRTPATLEIVRRQTVEATATPTAVNLGSAPPHSQLNAKVIVNGVEANANDYTFKWTQDPSSGGSLSSTTIANPTFTATQAGTYEFTVTATQKVAPFCSNSAKVTVTIASTGICPGITGNNDVCIASTNTYTASGTRASFETWTWSVEGGGAAIVGNNINVSSITVKAGSGNYTVKLTVSYANTAVKSLECTRAVTVKSCGGVFYTFTQGFYGSSTGKANCIVAGGISNPTAVSLIASAIQNMGGSLNIGLNGKSFMATTIQAADLNKLLPGGGTTEVLAGVYDPISVKPPLNSQGKIRNVLLSQTIALGLNLYIPVQGDNLRAFTFDANSANRWLVTQARNPASGCTTPTRLACSSTNTTSIRSWEIPLSVTNKLKGQPMTALFKLASDALGGVSTGVSLSDINRAVDAINNAFDAGRFFNEWAATSQSCPPLTLITQVNTLSNMTKQPAASVNELSVTATPNPYVDRVRFRIESPVSGQGSLEVYNLLGQKVQVLFQGYIQANKPQTLEYYVPYAQRAMLIYQFRVGSKTVSGKLLH